MNSNYGKKERYKRIFHIVLTVAIMGFIFLQSAMPDYASAQESGFFVNVAENVLNAITGKELNLDSLSFVIRKLAHFTEYAVFGCSLLLTTGDLIRSYKSRVEGLKAEPVTPNPPAFYIKSVLISWAIGTLYAVTDEFHQYFVPGRSCEVRDMILDSLGLATGIVILSLIYTRIKKK